MKEQEITVDFKEIVITDVENKDCSVAISKSLGKPLFKEISNQMYFNAKDVDTLELAREINKNGVLECNTESLNKVLDSVERMNVAFFIRLAIREFIKSKLPE